MKFVILNDARRMRTLLIQPWELDYEMQPGQSFELHIIGATEEFKMAILDEKFEIQLTFVGCSGVLVSLLHEPD